MLGTNPELDQKWLAILDHMRSVQQQAAAVEANRLAHAWPIANGDGRLVVALDTPQFLDRIEHRLAGPLNLAAAHVFGRDMQIEFVVEPAGRPATPPAGGPGGAAGEPAPEPSPAHLVAQADHYAALFGKGSAGYSRIARHTTGYVAPLIGGDAFLLWKSLEADDKRPLDDPANWWTPPLSCSFEELAARIGKRTGGCISGKEAECDRKNGSRKKRSSAPLTRREECCAYVDDSPPPYPLMRLKPHSARGYMCHHWAPGHLETLLRVGLAVAELKTPTSYKPTIQVWRMPTILTPFQYRFLPPVLQEEYTAWIASYGPLFGLPDLRAWQRITEPSLWPLMTGYAAHEALNNYLSQRDSWRQFLDQAFRNPAFSPVEPDCNLGLYLFQIEALAQNSGMHDSISPESEAASDDTSKN